MANSTNPYQHTTSVLQPEHRGKLYSDESMQILRGTSNQFSHTPTVNKYVRSTESATDLTKLPDLNPGTFETSPSRKSEQDVKTLNKRRLTAESLCDLYSMPCPFSNKDFMELASTPKQTINKRELSAESQHDIRRIPSTFEYRKENIEGPQARRHHFSAESRYDLERIPNPFVQDQDQRHNHPMKARSHYVFESPNVRQMRSQYAMDYQGPRAQVYYHSPRPSMVDLGPPFFLPNSAYDYTAYSFPYRTLLTQCDYDYTSYSQPMMPTPYYAPAPFMPHPHVNPYYYYRPPAASYHHQAAIPMYSLGIPYHLNNPMKAPSSPSSEFSRVDTEMDNMRIPNQFCPNPQQVPLRRPTTPNNETMNKYIRGVDSLADLRRLDVNFEPRTPLSYVGSPKGSSDHFQFRDFSVESMKDLRALPSFSSTSLPNEPSRDVYTAREP